MIDVNELRKGVTFELDGHIYKVLEYDHHKPGRGKATIRVDVRDLRTGTRLKKKFNSGDSVQDIRLTFKNRSRRAFDQACGSWIVSNNNIIKRHYISPIGVIMHC